MQERSSTMSDTHVCHCWVSKTELGFEEVSVVCRWEKSCQQLQAGRENPRKGRSILHVGDKCGGETTNLTHVHTILDLGFLVAQIDDKSPIYSLLYHANDTIHGNSTNTVWLSTKDSAQDHT